MTLKKTLAVGMSAALAVSLAACSSDSSGSKSGKNYVLANGSEPQNPLIPANTNETGGGRIVDVIYSGLVRYDSDGKAHNEQAESITLEGDRTYKVTFERRTEVLGWNSHQSRELRQDLELRCGQRSAQCVLL